MWLGNFLGRARPTEDTAAFAAMMPMILTHAIIENFELIFKIKPAQCNSKLLVTL